MNRHNNVLAGDFNLRFIMCSLDAELLALVAVTHCKSNLLAHLIAQVQAILKGAHY